MLNQVLSCSYSQQDSWIRNVLALSHRDCYLHTSASVTSPQLVSLGQGGIYDPASRTSWSSPIVSTAGIRALPDRRTVSESTTRSTPAGIHDCSPFSKKGQRAYAQRCLDVSFGTSNRCRFQPIHVFEKSRMKVSCIYEGAVCHTGRRPYLVRWYFAVKAFCMDQVAEPIGHVGENFEAHRGVFRLSI